MPNLITRYDNGTFEGLQAAWNEEYGFGTTAQVQDPTEFKEGLNSVKMTTANIDNPFFFTGVASTLAIRFPAVAGQSYRVSIWVKASAGMPDDAVFFLNPIVDATKPGFLIPQRASNAKLDWVEVVVYCFPIVNAGEAYMTLDIMWNSAAYMEQLSFVPQYLDFYNDLLTFTAQTPVPAGEFVWADFATADVSDIPEEPSLQFEGRRLYYVRNVFYLEIEGVRFPIDEPIKWNQVTVQIIFDEKTKMYRFEFSDKDVLLEFDNRSGRPNLKDVYKRKGTNADAKLLFGEFNTITEVLTIHYTGNINFENCSNTEKVFKANVERQSLGEKLRVYFDTRVNIFNTITLGGLARPILALKQLFLHPRLLTYKADYIYNKNIPVAQSLDPQVDGTGTVYVAIPPFKSTSNNITGLTQEVTPPDGLLVYAGLSFPPGITKRTFKISAGMSFRYTKTGSVQQPRAAFGILKISNISTAPPTTGFSVYGGALSYGQLGGILGGTYHVAGSFEGTIDLLPDEALFFRTTILNPVTGSPDSVYSDFTYENPDGFYLNIQEQTVFAPSLINVPQIHETVNRQLELITDKPNILKSNFLGRVDLGYIANGCASNHFAMDGKLIRKFINRGFNLSTKDLYNSLDGLFCIGMSVERDDNDVESVRLEEMPYFFKNVLLMKLTVISQYDSNPANKYLFNELGFGFTKYPQNNQQDSIEDFHTSMEYITPLTKIKNKLNVLIDAIVSGYYIEYTRQQSFLTNPTNAYETDNNLFYISARKSTAQSVGVNIVFDQANRKITIMKLIPVVDIDSLLIANGTGFVTNGTYTIASVEIPFSYDRVIVTVIEALATDGAGTGDVTIIDELGNPVDRYEAKRDEDFDTILGITFPKSVYNLEHQLKRVALRWAKFFQAGWAFTITGTFPNFEGIQFTEGKNNTEARTKLKSSVGCKYGDTLDIDRKDSAFESVENMDKPLFDKDEITFVAPLTWTAFNYIRKAYEGRNPDGRNYGYFQITNPDGEFEKVWATNLKFDPNKQSCKFTTIKKYDG